MDVKNYLISMGTDAETAAEIAANPKYASVYEKAAASAEEGKTALLKAQETKTQLEKWNQETVIPYVQDADNKVAAERAKNAAMVAHMKSLKEAGYDIPAAYLDGSENTAPVKVAPVAEQKDYDSLIQKGQLAQMELIDLANEAYDLTGKRISVNAEYKEFATAARPGENLRGYVTRKYDLENIRSTKETEKQVARDKAIADTAVAAAQAEWAKSHGANGETRIPVNSRFDKVIEARKGDSSSDKDGRPLWQTQAGRAEATKRRLEKYQGQIN